jgi:hypothetical protein
MINVRTLSFEALRRPFRQVSETEAAPQAPKTAKKKRSFLADFEQMLMMGISPVLPEDRSH